MSGCDRRWEVDAYREGRLGDKDAQSFERHLRACSDCRHRKDCDERLRVIGQALPHDEPSELTLRRLRTRILRDVATGAGQREPSRVARVAVAAGLALVLGAGAWATFGRTHTVAVAPPPVAPATTTVAAPVAPAPVEPRDALAGTVTVLQPARWSQARKDGVERVTLDDGVLGLHVRHQQPGERFLVAMPDGEVEVRGTTFDVSVAAGTTRRVHVDEGLVELRLGGHSVASLGAGDTWTAPAAVVASSPPSPGDRPAAARASATASGAPPGAPRPADAPAVDDGASDYARAVQALRDGRASEAAVGFHAFLVAHPGAPQAEDASFLEGVALARAGRGDAAALAAEDHLARYPASFHRREAAILVARAASQRGDCARARAVLGPWLADAADADVRSALGSCATAAVTP
jgi:hypothetical protein